MYDYVCTKFILDNDQKKIIANFEGRPNSSYDYVEELNNNTPLVKQFRVRRSINMTSLDIIVDNDNKQKFEQMLASENIGNLPVMTRGGFYFQNIFIQIKDTTLYIINVPNDIIKIMTSVANKLQLYKNSEYQSIQTEICKRPIISL